MAGQDTVIADSTLPTGTISGTLTDSDGNPLQHVEAYAAPWTSTARRTPPPT